jgi:phosphate/sulfate permease
MAARASRRAAMMAMAALAVIITSQQGLPISTTQVTIGAVLGIGFLRESLKANCERIIAEIEQHHSENGSEQHEIEAFPKVFRSRLAHLQGPHAQGDQAAWQTRRKPFLKMLSAKFCARGIGKTWSSAP